MEEFESIVLDASDRDRWWGSGVAVITTPGQREWRFYTPDSQSFVTRFSTALAGHGPYPLELSQFEDPEWNALHELRQ